MPFAESLWIGTVCCMPDDVLPRLVFEVVASVSLLNRSSYLTLGYFRQNSAYIMNHDGPVQNSTSHRNSEKSTHFCLTTCVCPFGSANLVFPKETPWMKACTRVITGPFCKRRNVSYRWLDDIVDGIVGQYSPCNCWHRAIRPGLFSSILTWLTNLVFPFTGTWIWLPIMYFHTKLR